MVKKTEDLIIYMELYKGDITKTNVLEYMIYLNIIIEPYNY
jgi:hypothetical protein